MAETAPRLTDVGYIRDLLDRHGFHFSKKSIVFSNLL